MGLPLALMPTAAIRPPLQGLLLCLLGALEPTPTAARWACGEGMPLIAAIAGYLMIAVGCRAPQPVRGFPTRRRR